MRNPIFVLTILAGSLAAQNLTPAQKDADFRNLAGLFATYYAPADWKKAQFGFDIYDLKPWLDRVAKTTTDLDFYELEVEYISRLNDTHVSFILPSDFNARLGFGVDLYDDTLLIDTIDRSLLPTRDYPFGIGDELVSIDGVDAKKILDSLMMYVPQGNPRSSRRQVAARITNRSQSRFPHAPDLPEKSVVVIKRQSGAMETYTIAWTRTGTPLTVGPVTSPRTAASAKRTASIPLQPGEPDYMRPLRELQFSGVIDPDHDTGVNGYGSRNPIFVNGLPPTFTRRLGGAANDFFYSGTFKFQELTIGYIRIPNFSPPSTVTQLRVFEQEIAYMSANTDGLIIDDMRNTGGSLCFGEEIAARLIPYEFQATGFSTSAFWGRVNSFYNAMISAKSTGASTEIVQQYETIYGELLAANKEGRLTVPVPLCTSSLTRKPLRDANGNLIAYQKPIIVLIDEFSTSTADSFAAMMQESGRAVLYGWRTNGAGGNNTSFDAGVYSESLTGMTLALQTRATLGWNSRFPSSNLIENTGVSPFIWEDYMTRDNLLRGGAGFVDSVLQHMAAYVRSKK